MNDDNEWSVNLSLPQARTSELRGRQSVRATFKLTEACIGAISIVAAHLGIKQKSLFDHLVEDINTLNSIAGELRNVSLKNFSRVQKTYVISRKSLYSLDEVSKNSQCSPGCPGGILRTEAAAGHHKGTEKTCRPQKNHGRNYPTLQRWPILLRQAGKNPGP